MGDVIDEKIKKLSELIEKNLRKEKNIELLTSLSLYKTQLSFDLNFLIVRIDTLKYNDLKKLRERIELLDFKFKGIIVIKD